MTSGRPDTIGSRQARIADLAQRYWELTRLIADARRTAADLHDELVAWIEETGEPIAVEGLPELRLVERRGPRAWDARALAEREPGEFQRLLALGCLTIHSALADAQVRAGNLSGLHRRFGWDAPRRALVFDR
jgi:hypothetical protein